MRHRGFRFRRRFCLIEMFRVTVPGRLMCGHAHPQDTARRVRSENRSLESEQQSHRRDVTRIKEVTSETKLLCEKKISELEGQMQDLLFFIKAQQEVLLYIL